MTCRQTVRNACRRPVVQPEGTAVADPSTPSSASGNVPAAPNQNNGSGSNGSGKGGGKGQKKQKQNSPNIEEGKTAAEILELRADKAKQLEASGHTAFAYCFDRTHSAAELQEQYKHIENGAEAGENVSVAVAGAHVQGLQSAHLHVAAAA